MIKKWGDTEVCDSIVCRLLVCCFFFFLVKEKDGLGMAFCGFFSCSFSSRKGTKSMFDVARWHIYVLSGYMYLCLSVKSGNMVPGTGEYNPCM